jgi:hypothetical protein
VFVYDHASGEITLIPADAFNVLNYYVTPSLMDFGSVNLGQTYDQTLQIYNPNSFDLNLNLSVLYISGGTGCIDLSIPGGLRPDNLTATVPSEETLGVQVTLTPIVPETGEAWLLPLPSPPEPEIVVIWVPNETESWHEIEINFGTVYVSSKVHDVRRLISDLNDPATDVQAYIANHPNQVRLSVDGRARFDPVTFQLQPGVPVDLGITFYPGETGPWTDNIVFHDLTNGIYYYAPMNAEVLPATINVFPQEINLGDVPLGFEVQFPCEVQNSTPELMPVSHFAFNNGWTGLSVDGSPEADSLYYMLQPNEIRQAFVIFHALQAGQWSGYMYLYDHLHNALYEKSVSANVVIPPTLLVAPPEINYGNVFPNQYYYHPLDVHNQTDEVLTISHYVTADDGSVNLNLVGKTWSDSVYYSIGPGEIKHLEVRMGLSELGPLSMMITAYVHETGETFQTPVYAVGVPALYITPPVCDFGLTYVGNSYFQVVQVQNGSGSSMNIEHYVTADDGSVNLNLVGKNRTDPLNYILLPGQSQNVEVIFTPQVPGPWDNSMTLTDNISGTQYIVPMHAMVDMPQTGLVIAPLIVEFGNVLMNETRAQIFDFTNNTDQPLQIGHYVTGDDGSVNLNLIGKSRSDSLYFVIQPYQTESVLMDYTPQTPGLWNCNMQAYDYTSGITYNFTVSANNIPVIYITVPNAGQVVMDMGETTTLLIEVENPNPYNIDVDTDTPIKEKLNISYTGLEKSDSLSYVVQAGMSVQFYAHITPLEPGNGYAEMSFFLPGYGYQYLVPLFVTIGLPAPEPGITRIGTNIMLEWEPVPGALHYEILEAEQPAGPYFWTASTAFTSIMLPALEDKRFYRIKAICPE